MRFPAALLIALACAAPVPATASSAEPTPPPKQERRITSSPSWIMVDPITVAILRQNRIQGIFLVEFGLDIEDEKLRAVAQETLPRLRDAWLRNMSDLAATRIRIGRQADLDVLTTRLQSTTDQMLGGPGAKILLLQAVVRQR